MTTRWAQLRTGRSAEEYAEDVATSAAESDSPHGEADFVGRLVPPGARVLDAGCGTGRVAVRLAEQGYAVTAVDADAGMLEVARRASDGVTWALQDLAELPELATGGDGRAADGPFEVVLLAGNVVPLVAEGTLVAVVARLAERLARSGMLVAGFGVDADHLPEGCPVTSFEEYAEACRSAGLELRQVFDSWGAVESPESTYPEEGAGYVVAVHAVPGQVAP